MWINSEFNRGANNGGNFLEVKYFKEDGNLNSIFFENCNINKIIRAFRKYKSFYD